MASRQIIRDMMNKYCVKKLGEDTLDPKVEWKTWEDVPALVHPFQLSFRFEGEFVDKYLTPTEAKVLALHEIAHFNTGIFSQNVDYTQHGHPIQELSFYGLINRERIPYTRVNAAMESIHKKWTQYSKR